MRGEINVPIDQLFEVHRLNEEGMQRAEAIATAFNECLKILKGICPDGREFSIVKTKLEEAAFFAKKAMARVAENQDDGKTQIVR
jgi:hypothetical protein